MPQITGARPMSGLRLRPPKLRPPRPGQPLLAAGHRVAAGPVDRAIDHWLASTLSDHLVLLDGWADCGAPFEVTVTAAVVFVACLCARWLRGALLVAAAVAAGGLAEYALKPLFGRTLYGALSYPSGHTIGAFTLAVPFAVLLTGPRHPPLPG